MFGGFREFHLKEEIVHQGYDSTHEKVLLRRELYGAAKRCGLLQNATVSLCSSGQSEGGRYKGKSREGEN
jgi:hypothetical protein